VTINFARHRPVQCRAAQLGIDRAEVSVTTFRHGGKGEAGPRPAPRREVPAAIIGDARDWDESAGWSPRSAGRRRHHGRRPVVSYADHDHRGDYADERRGLITGRLAAVVAGPGHRRP
jgi:hypothetical protein